MVLIFFLIALFLTSCATPERDNPYDPDGVNYQGDKISSSSVIVPSSSSASVVPVVPSSSSAQTQTSVIHDTPVYYEGETYETVIIGSQTWMARNLNYDVSGSICGGNDCATYGRLYRWATAMNLPARCNPNPCASQVDAKHRGICPEGWHMPSDAEWRALTDFVGSPALTKLEAYGFAALPGGACSSDGSFYSIGEYGYWWSGTEYDGTRAARWSTYRLGDIYAQVLYYSKIDYYSVRCIKD